MRTIVCAAIAATIALPALAQQPNQPARNAPSATNPPAAATAPARQAGQWRASKLIGVDVYNQQNEKLGEIDELIIDRSGRVAGAIIGVGGFLGMGERNVMIPMDKLQFRDDDNRSTTGSNRANNDRDWYPDRAVLNANKDQLKAMTEFKY
jgi:sporulation protein YlmC with PRC-barrel domain